VAGIITFLLIAPAPASAQLARVGDTILMLGGSGGRTTTDTAYDPASDVYLVLSASGPIVGVFINAANQPVSNTFLVYDGLTGYGHNPRARYSPDIPNGVGGFGGFLVVWDNGAAANTIRGAFVSYFAGSGNVVTAPIQISDPAWGSIFMENRPTLAYSATSKRFLVAWTNQAFAIQGRFVNITGAPEDFHVYEGGTSRDPALTWNPATNLFGLGNTGFAGAPYAQFRLVSPGDGAWINRSTFGVGVAGTFATGIDVNAANQFVMTWGLGPGTRAATFDANGTMLAGPTFITDSLGGDLSMGLAYNPVSGTFLAVSSSWTSYDIGAVEITAGGAPNSLATIVTAGASSARGSFYPLVAARTHASDWNVAHSRGFLDARTQIVTTSSTGGGSGVPLPPASPAPGPTPTPTTGGCTTPDPFAAIGGGECVNGGWVPKPPAPAPAPAPIPSPTPAPPGTCTTPDPFAAIGGGHCVNGGWLPGPDPGTPAPAPAPTPTPTPSPTVTCTTPDPFVAIGGGHCVNGGWLPGPDVNPAPAPSPAPAPAPSPGTCTTPDPFASIGGGRCVNGGWVPNIM
jgi:hypothetical protein